MAIQMFRRNVTISAPARRNDVLGAVLAAGDARRLPITGVVTAVDAATHRITLAHEAIGGVMPAMQMTLDAEAAAPRVIPGDRVAATLVITERSSHLVGMAVTARAAGPVLSMPTVPPAPAPGSLPPALPLTNQDGDTFTLRQFQGNAVLVSFIYTRCPVSEYCPLTMRQLAGVRRQFARDQPALASRLRVIAITLDPEHDGPGDLRAYGQALIGGPNPFAGWSLATGSPTDIRQVVNYFGIAAGPAAGPTKTGGPTT